MSNQAARRRFEPAESLLLESVGDRANQKGPADLTGRRPSIQSLPAPRRSLISAFGRLAISTASAARSGAGARRFMIVPLRILQRSGRSQSPCAVLFMSGRLAAPMTHTSSIRAEQPVLRTLAFARSAPPKVARKFGDLGTTRRVSGVQIPASPPPSLTVASFSGAQCEIARVRGTF